MLVASISIFGYLAGITFFFEKDLLKSLKIIIFFSIFILTALFLLEGNPTSEIFYFLLICVLWLPLSIDDLQSNSVNPFFLYFASFLSCACLFMVKTPEIIELIISPLLVLIVFLVALMIKNRKGSEAIGPADYLAIFSFSFSLSSYSVGIWIILFSTVGIIHSVINGRQSIPLIPFLFSAWCLAYAYYQSINLLSRGS